MWNKKFNRLVHPVWCIAWFCGGTIGGIALSVRVKNHLFDSPDVLVITGLLLIFALLKHRMALLLFALLAGLMFGMWRGTSEQGARAAYKPYYGKKITLHGVVSEDTSFGPQGDQRLRVQAIQIDNNKLPGIMWVAMPETVHIKRGDTVVLKGQLVPGFGNIPAAMYRASIVSVTRPMPGDVARRVRDWFAEGVRRAIPEPEASLSVGYLVGQRTALPEGLSDQLRVVGLTHAVVASGYNLTILVGFTRRLLARFSKYLATFLAVMMTSSFVLITGFSPSMTRAGLVSMLGLIAWYYGRSFHPVVLLILAAAITAVWRPSYVWGDIGWYLSFVAFTGVIILAPLLQRYFWGNNKNVGMLRQTLLDTTSAQLLTMPIILYSFGQYATYALLANVLVLPLVPIAMLLTFVAGVGGLVVPSIAHWIGVPAKLILWSNLLVISWVSRLPGASGEISFGLRALIVSYVFLGIVMAYLWRVTKYNFRAQDNQQVTLF